MAPYLLLDGHSHNPRLNLDSLHAEAYHLEAYNSDPMLGFFNEPLKFYFLIWNIAHCTSRYRLLCGSNGGGFVLLVVWRFSTFFRAHQENQTIDGFFGAASAISSLEIIEVSIAGKHFLYQNKS